MQDAALREKVYDKAYRLFDDTVKEIRFMLNDLGEVTRDKLVSVSKYVMYNDEVKSVYTDKEGKEYKVLYTPFMFELLIDFADQLYVDKIDANTFNNNMDVFYKLHFKKFIDKAYTIIKNKKDNIFQVEKNS